MEPLIVTQPDPTAGQREPAARAVGPAWAAAAVSGAIAAIATTLVAAIAREAGVSFAVDGEAIPLASFPQLTLLCVLVGGALAHAFQRRARTPRRTFVATSLVLTAVSLVPDTLLGLPAAATATLMLTHLLAAAIVIPAIARRLHP